METFGTCSYVFIEFLLGVSGYFLIAPWFTDAFPKSPQFGNIANLPGGGIGFLKAAQKYGFTNIWVEYGKWPLIFLWWVGTECYLYSFFMTVAMQKMGGALFGIIQNLSLGLVVIMNVYLGIATYTTMEYAGVVITSASLLAVALAPLADMEKAVGGRSSTDLLSGAAFGFTSMAASITRPLTLNMKGWGINEKGENIEVDLWTGSLFLGQSFYATIFTVAANFGYGLETEDTIGDVKKLLGNTYAMIGFVFTGISGYFYCTGYTTGVQVYGGSWAEFLKLFTSSIPWFIEAALDSSKFDTFTCVMTLIQIAGAYVFAFMGRA